MWRTDLRVHSNWKHSTFHPLVREQNYFLVLRVWENQAEEMHRLFSVTLQFCRHAVVLSCGTMKLFLDFPVSYFFSLFSFPFLLYKRLSLHPFKEERPSSHSMISSQFCFYFNRPKTSHVGVYFFWYFSKDQALLSFRMNTDLYWIIRFLWL